MSFCEAVQSFVCDSFDCNRGDRHVARGQGAAAGGVESSPALLVGRGGRTWRGVRVLRSK